MKMLNAILVCFFERNSEHEIGDTASNMLKLVLLFLGLLSATRAGSTRLTRQAVSITVEVDLPWNIQFAIPTSPRFEPLSLTAVVHRPSDRVSGSNVGFTSQLDGSSQRFRNLQPLRLQTEDVIVAVVEYSTHKGAVFKRTAFNYTIHSSALGKQFDVLTLNIDVDFNPSADKPSETESNEFSDEPNIAKTPQNSAQHMTPQNTQRDAFCLSPEAVGSMMAEIQYLEAQLQTALEVGRIDRQLVLTGSLPPGPNAVDAIRALITDKLQLPHLSQSILQARFIEKELLFEVSSPRQKLEVLTKARLMLERSPYKIASTERNVFGTAIYARSNTLH